MVYIQLGGESGKEDWPIRTMECGREMEPCLGQQEKVIFRAREDSWVRKQRKGESGLFRARKDGSIKRKSCSLRKSSSVLSGCG
jgi:hypothetical protein